MSIAAITPEKGRVSASGRSPRSASSGGSASPNQLWESTRPSASPRSANPNPNAWASPRACSPKASAVQRRSPTLGGKSPRSRSSLSPPVDDIAQSKEDSLTEQQLEAAAQDPALARFFKMRAMGIPLGAIQQKMSMEEGIDAKIIDAFVDIPAPGGGGSSSNTTTQPEPKCIENGRRY